MYCTAISHSLRVFIRVFSVFKYLFHPEVLRLT